MRYFLRAVKYFVRLMVILALVIAVLALAGFVEKDLSKIFVGGYDSYWQIALLMAAFAALYPRLGYSRRPLTKPGETSEIEPEILRAMDVLGYVKESGDGERMTFRKRSAADRAMKFWEDRITFERSLDGYTVEGITKDVLRVIYSL